MREVLGRLPLVGAGFQLLAFGLSCNANIVAFKADEKQEHCIREEMAYVTGLTVTEMVRAAKQGPKGHAHLKELSKIMERLESTVRMLDAYVLSRVLEKLLLNKDLLPNMMETLRKLRKELRDLQATKGFEEPRTGQVQIKNMVTSLCDSTEERQNEMLHRLAKTEEDIQEDSGVPDV